MKLIFTTCFLFLFSFLQAQKGFEVGGWLGLSYYFGDLNTTYSLQKPGPGIGGIARYNFNDRIDLKFGANFGMIAGDDMDSNNPFERTRNLSFRSIVVDAALQFEFNFFPYVHGSIDRFSTPYIFAGLGMFYFDPQAKYEGEWYHLRDYGTEGQFAGDEYSLFQGALVYGMGYKFDISDYWSINIEWSGRKPFTDYLDDVSDTYPNMTELRARHGDIAVALSDRSVEFGDIRIGEERRQRGNGRNDDSYHFISIGVVYYIGLLLCPDISKPKGFDRP